MLLLFPVLLLAYVLFGLSISIVVSRSSGRWAQSRHVQWVVFVALFALFFGDEIYGYWNWRRLCKTEGGLHIYKQVPVEGFVEKGRIHEGIAEEFLDKGYAYIESGYYRDYGEKRGQLYRYSLSNGSVIRTPINTPQSRFYHSEGHEVSCQPYVLAHESYIKNRVTGEFLSVKRQLYYKGATVVRTLRKITGAEQSAYEQCGASPLNNQLLATIPPLKGVKHE